MEQRWTPRKLLFFITLVVCTLQAKAQEDKIESDMGDQNAQVLKPGQTQLETMLTYADINDNGANPLVGSLFLRYGWSKNVEFRALLQDGKHRDRFMQNTLQGFYPLCIGAKAQLIKDKTYLPDVAVSGYLNLPLTARTKEQTLYWAPALIVILEKELVKNTWLLQANTGIQQNSFDKKYQYQATARVKYLGLGKTELIAEYLDNYGHKQQPQHLLTFGIEHAIRNNFEINACVGATVFSAQTYQYGSVGVSLRLPN